MCSSETGVKFHRKTQHYIPEYISMNMKLCTVHMSFLDPNTRWPSCAKKGTRYDLGAADIIEESIAPRVPYSQFFLQIIAQYTISVFSADVG
jgi:hypothetical protein